MKTLIKPIAIGLLLLSLVTIALASANSLQTQQQPGGTSSELYIIVVAEAPDEKIARTMAVVIREVVRGPVHLYRGDDRIMIILTGHPVSLEDAQLIGGDLKAFELFQGTPYPRSHSVESVNYCDQTQRCLELQESEREGRSMADI